MVLLEKFTEGGKRIRSSSLEQSMWEVLEKLGIVFEKQKHIGPFFVDIFVPMENLIIECDGEYWHNLPGRPEKDRKRDDYLKEKGFGVIHILEKDIRNNPRLALLDRVAF